MARESQHPDALHLLGVIAHRRGQYHDAIDLINRALKKNNRDIRFHIHLSHIAKQTDCKIDSDPDKSP